MSHVPPSPSQPAPAFVVLHADARWSLATDALLLPPAHAPAFFDALEFAQALTRLHDEERSRVQAAVDAGQAHGAAEGHALGYSQGLQLAATSLADAVAHLHAQSAVQTDELQQQVVSLALLVVRRIAADLAPESVLTALARRAFEHLADGGLDGTAPWRQCQLRVHPDLLPSVQQRLSELDPQIKVVADDSLSALDCVLDTPGGRLLAGLETQLARIQASLSRPPMHGRAEAVTAP